MKEKELNAPILTTEPHGEQSLRPCEVSSSNKIGNQLFELSENSGDAAIVMTGEELHSLAMQWINYVIFQKAQNGQPYSRV